MSGVAPVPARVPVPGLDAELGPQAVGDRAEPRRAHRAEVAARVDDRRVAVLVAVERGADREGQRQCLHDAASCANASSPSAAMSMLGSLVGEDTTLSW